MEFESFNERCCKRAGFSYLIYWFSLRVKNEI